MVLARFPPPIVWDNILGYLQRDFATLRNRIVSRIHYITRQEGKSYGPCTIPPTIWVIITKDLKRGFLHFKTESLHGSSSFSGLFAAELAAGYVIVSLHRFSTVYEHQK